MENKDVTVFVTGVSMSGDAGKKKDDVVRSVEGDKDSTREPSFALMLILSIRVLSDMSISLNLKKSLSCKNLYPALKDEIKPGYSF